MKKIIFIVLLFAFACLPLKQLFAQTENPIPNIPFFASENIIDTLISGIFSLNHDFTRGLPVLTSSLPENLRIKKINSALYALKSLENDAIEIGIESNQPYLRLNKWEGEVFLKVKIPYVIDKTTEFIGDKLRYYSGNKIIEFYPKAPEKISEKIRGQIYEYMPNEYGGIEFDIILKEKPLSNVFTFPIESKGLKFYYQPPLHPEHPTWLDENGDGKADSFRPKNTVGSYAVYHESKEGDYSLMGGKNYRAGKALHIYRPKIIDANGDWVWGELNINEQKQAMTITIDRNWLNDASYPVIIDPRFGYTTLGSATYTTTNVIRGTPYASGGIGTAAISITAGYGYVPGTHALKCAIYNGTTFVAGTEERTNCSSGSWNNFNISGTQPAIANQDYGLVSWGGPGGNFAYDWAAGTRYTQSLTYGDWPDPINAAGSSNETHFSIYCTFTAPVKFEGTKMEGIKVN